MIHRNYKWTNPCSFIHTVEGRGVSDSASHTAVKQQTEYMSEWIFSADNASRHFQISVGLVH